MKRVFVVLIAAVFLAAPAFGLTLAWEQESVENVSGWRVYVGSESGGPYNQIMEVPKGDNAGPEYTGTVPTESLPVGETFWVVRAFNPFGESGDSNEAFQLISPPTSPILLKIYIGDAQ